MSADIKFYLKLLIRRLPVMVVLFLICAIAGAVIAQRLPTMYRTSATLLVESAQISDDLVRSTVQVEASEQLEVIQQRLLTRANLLDIARDIEVFPQMNTMTPDEIVQAMREATGIRRSSGRNRATLMTISFQGRDPQKVADVVNRYTSIVLDLSTGARTEAAEGTLNFFREQVSTLSQALDAQSARIVAFKTENADALPENLDYRLNRQALVQERVARAGRELENLRAQRAQLERLYESTGSLAGVGNIQLTPAQQELQALEGELRTALSIYSEQNPRVRNLRNRIEALRGSIDTDVAATDTGAPQDSAPQSAQATALEISLSEQDAKMDTLRREIAEDQAELEILRDSIQRTPVNSTTLAAMERELANTQNLYSTAVKQQAQARMGEQIELSSKGERITVVEAANVPTTPSSPNRPRIIVLGVALGLGLAGAFFMFLELINQSIRRPVDIVKSMEITPLATVPRIETAAHKRMRRVAQVASLAVVLAGVPALLWAVDTYYMPLDLLFERIKDRLV
jgi:polysaccharide chain length determinant protein (PEP-CTERM system associated)